MSYKITVFQRMDLPSPSGKEGETRCVESDRAVPNPWVGNNLFYHGTMVTSVNSVTIFAFVTTCTLADTPCGMQSTSWGRD
jgi:hypothetical protein